MFVPYVWSSMAHDNFPGHFYQIVDCMIKSTIRSCLVLENLVPRTKIFAGKYGPPFEKSVRAESAHFRPSFSNRRI